MRSKIFLRQHHELKTKGRRVNCVTHRKGISDNTKQYTYPHTGPTVAGNPWSPRADSRLSWQELGV